MKPRFFNVILIVTTVVNCLLGIVATVLICGGNDVLGVEIYAVAVVIQFAVVYSLVGSDDAPS